MLGTPKRVLTLAAATVMASSLCLCSNLLRAQETNPSSSTPQATEPFTAIRGQFDQGLPFPQFIPISGWRQDKGALAEINAYRSQTGVQKWIDMRGQGTIRYGNDQSIEGQARVEIRQPAMFRLDTVLDGGKMTSLRRSGDNEQVSRETALSKSVDVRDAGAGLFLFPHIEESAFPETNDLLIDNGPAIVDGQTYHRITLEYPPSAAGNQNDFASWIVVDLYFDPSTHLLEKSASIAHSIGSSALMVRVVTYGNYQQNGQTLIPMTYRETLNGQIAWTLQLAQVALNSGISNQDFTF